jgi:BirA family biotin operon repressor/biotin-[acetyl-CoA-carboxylase] ligase
VTELAKEASRLRSALAKKSVPFVEAIDTFQSIASTNSWLLAQAAPAPGQCRVALAEHQSSGRGRLGRTWLSAPGASLCLSVAFTLRKRSSEIAGLTLALATQVTQVLERTGATDVKIKWPNDLVLRDGKLGGILTELRSPGSTVTVVAGLGLNLANRPELARWAEPGWANRPASLSEAVATPIDRVQLAASIVDAWIEGVAQFEKHGFSPFEDAWNEHDYLRGKPVYYGEGNNRQRGRVTGIDRDGALLVEHEGEQIRIIAGDIEPGDHGLCP